MYSQRLDATLDFQIQLTGVQEQVTVTATGTNKRQQVQFNQSRLSDRSTLQRRVRSHLAKRSMANSEYPNAVLGRAPRGLSFEVLMAIVCSFCRTAIALADWASSQAIMRNRSMFLTVEKVEIVKGPATLLYGSNAIGGVVNTISGHDSAHKGFNGYLTGIGSTNGPQGGGSGGIRIRYGQMVVLGQWRRSKIRRLQHANRSRAELLFTRDECSSWALATIRTRDSSVSTTTSTSDVTAFPSILTKSIRRSSSSIHAVTASNFAEAFATQDHSLTPEPFRFSTTTTSTRKSNR